jgi:peptidoglycan/LPS O-acetylase OafA/YrhL
MEQKTVDRHNNFDFIRLVLASLVIVAHSYTLTGKDEILSVFTNGQIGFGALAVDCFFILSGYFIFLSLQRSKNLGDYFWKRLLRLYPALIVLLLFTFFLIPFLYVGNHLTSTLKAYPRYFLGGISLYNVQYFISGVFENNPYRKAVNGSLWSLSYEFSMYVITSFFFLIKKTKSVYIVMAVLIALFIILSLFKADFLKSYFSVILLHTNNFYKLAAYFLAGSILTCFDLQKMNNLMLKCALFMILLGSLFLNIYPFIAPLALPLFVMLIGISATKYISSTGDKIGDISYGVYIYGFLVQQVFMNYFNLSAIGLMILSIPTTYLLAYISWHLVEKRMLKYKNLF